jgi:hypothetical protein
MAQAATDQLKKLVQSIFDTHADDVIDCERCNEQLCHLVELVAGGADLCQLIPAVEAHLACCADCKEEWDALLCIIRAEQTGTLTQTS